MQVVMRKIRDLKPYKNNAKKHPKEQINRIAESIKEFGFTQPVLIDKNNEVVVGHGRILGAKQAGLKEVPTVMLEDLTEEQIKAYRLIDNKLNESDWDYMLLDQEVEQLLQSDIDMSLFGFEENDEEQTERKKVEFEAKKQNKVIVECISAKQAEDLYNRLIEDGYQCQKRTV